MLNYLIILLDDSSVSFCHYNHDKTDSRLIDYKLLRDAIKWSMKENLFLQFIYPDYELPKEYKDLISSVDHSDIVSSNCLDSTLKENAEVVVFNSLNTLEESPLANNQTYILRTTLKTLIDNQEVLKLIIPKVLRLNVIITDVENFDEDSQTNYNNLLEDLSTLISEEYVGGHIVQINILTDRIFLDSMNNCGAGDKSITLAPNGKFYICPGFYLDGSNSIGNILDGVDIKNPQLFRIENAPICRICDAWQCKRCVWLNKNLTLEVNTPSREQCVMAHIERNASGKLLAKIRDEGEFMPDKEIPKLSYIDPFEEVIANQNK